MYFPHLTIVLMVLTNAIILTGTTVWYFDTSLLTALIFLTLILILGFIVGLMEGAVLAGISILASRKDTPKT